MYFGTQSFYIPSGSSVTLHDIMDGKSFTKEIFKEYAEMWINILIQHILYLCSDKADITDTGVREKKENFPRRYNKKTDVVEKEVGANISKELAALYNDERIDGVKSKYIRRAHWHNRWVGRLNSPERRLILTWQQPSLVNIRYRAWSELSDEVKDAEEKADHELELQLSHISDKSDVSISYLNKPIPRPNKLRDSKRAYVYPRSKKTAVNALHHAHYQCEISKDHTTFIRKRSNLPYVEPHHLVPLAFQDDFEVSLDREQNIISLCCNCHKKIHLGKDLEELLRTCYELRKDSLRAIGIDISYEELLQMYK